MPHSLLVNSIRVREASGQQYGNAFSVDDSFADIDPRVAATLGWN
jgi:hypothetical protein